MLANTATIMIMTAMTETMRGTPRRLSQATGGLSAKLIRNAQTSGMKTSWP